MKTQPLLLTMLFYIFITISYIIRFFIGNIYGIFLLALITYWNADKLFSINPYTFEQLLLWFSSQSESTITALLSTIITVIGFMLTYATATANWKGQLLANLKLQAAGELDVFFSEYSKLVTSCDIYATALIDAVNKIQNGCSLEEATFLTDYNYKQGEIFQHNRQQLIGMGINVHNFQGRYSTLLLSSPSLKSSLDSAIAAVTCINDKIWINVPFHIAGLISGDEQKIINFVEQVNIADCLALNEAITTYQSQLNFSAGKLRGQLMATVVGFNIWTVINLYSQHRDFYSVMAEVYVNKKNKKV
ncbi:TPA: hypothetical protein RUY06_000999 [Aeromonas veronii]|nr:hypothetical protein [Aeromonas veronii]